MDDSAFYRTVLGKRMIRWSLILTILIAFFWIGFRITKGYVPVTTDYLYIDIDTMPGISRWWDILLGTPLAILSAYLFTNSSVDSNKKIYQISVAMGLTIGLLSLYLDSLGAHDLATLSIVALSCFAVLLIFLFIFRSYKEIGLDAMAEGMRTGLFTAVGATIPLVFQIGVGGLVLCFYLVIILVNITSFSLIFHRLFFRH